MKIQVLEVTTRRGYQVETRVNARVFKSNQIPPGFELLVEEFVELLINVAHNRRRALSAIQLSERPDREEIQGLRSVRPLHDLNRAQTWSPSPVDMMTVRVSTTPPSVRVVVYD